jgi:hypothetical protein
MNKKYIYWGVGLIAVGGLVYYFMSGRSSGAKSLESGSSSDQRLTNGSNSSSSEAGTTTDSALESVFTSAGTRKKQIRVNCRVEAKARFPRGRQRRQWRKECRENGGFDDGLDME